MPSLKPAVPQNFGTLFSSSTSVRLVWSDAASTGSRAQTPTTYSVWVRTSDNQQWTMAHRPVLYGVGQDTFIDLVDLTPATVYQFKLVASNPFGYAETPVLRYTTSVYMAPL